MKSRNPFFNSLIVIKGIPPLRYRYGRDDSEEMSFRIRKDDKRAYENTSCQ
jgi:hypothetical protein